VTAFTAASAGVVSVAADGTFTITGHPGGNTVVTFTYTISDGSFTATATVSIGIGDSEFTCP